MPIEINSSTDNSFAVDSGILVKPGLYLWTQLKSSVGHAPWDVQLLGGPRAPYEHEGRLQDLQGNESNPKGTGGLVLHMYISCYLWSGKQRGTFVDLSVKISVGLEKKKIYRMLLPLKLRVTSLVFRASE